MSKRMHYWTHEATYPEMIDALGVYQTFFSAQLAKLIGKLKSTKDAYGNPLLASTMVVCATELGGCDDPYHGRQGDGGHPTANLPIVVFGGGIKGGRYIHGNSPPSADIGNHSAAYIQAGKDTAKLMNSVKLYMGLPDAPLGNTGVSGRLDLLYG